MGFIITEFRDRTGYIILNRPEKKNALNATFVEEIKEALKALHSNPGVRSIVIKSSGDVFCAGADLAYLEQLQSFSYEENLQDSRNLAELFRLIYSFSKPVISLVKGPALAGGCGLATVCDMCFATPEATFGYTESRIGFIPAIVMVFLRNKTGEARSKRLLFTGEILSSEKAMEYGLISEIMLKEEIDERVHDFAEKLNIDASGNSLASIKAMYNHLEGLNLDDALEYACKMNAAARETDDCKKGISSFLNKQKPVW